MILASDIVISMYRSLSNEVHSWHDTLLVHVLGAVMVVIVWQLDLQLTVQSLPISITTKNCEFKPSSWRGSLDTTLPYVIKFVSDLRQVCSFIRVLRFPPQKKWLQRNNWNIVESGITHHKLNSVTLVSQLSNFWILFWYSYSKNSQWEHCIQYTGIKCFQVHTKKNYMYVIITIDPVTLNLHDPFITPPRKNGFNFRSMLFHTDLYLLRTYNIT